MQATQCSVDGCDRNIRKREWCDMHYMQLMRAGVITNLPVQTVAERLAAGLVRMPNGCLEWTGVTNRGGYGRIWFNGKIVMAHRLAWELVNGPIPEGMLIRHLVCDNPPCCNVDHLRPGTQVENLADMVAKDRHGRYNSVKTHCPQHHEYTEANTYLSPQGRRTCRTCKRAKDVRRDAKRRQAC